MWFHQKTTFFGNGALSCVCATILTLTPAHAVRLITEAQYVLGRPAVTGTMALPLFFSSLFGVYSRVFELLTVTEVMDGIGVVLFGD
jgi:hypothetical protein